MTKIDIFSGFLGAGKTTLIKKLIKEAYTGEKLVIIENEFGEVGVDAGFLQDSGIKVTEMNSGCICCSLVGDFGEALKKVLTEYKPDRILIEPSGVGKLSDVIKAVKGVDSDEIALNSATTVVNAHTCRMYEKNFGEFFDNQLEYAGTIVLRHSGDISEDKLAAAVEIVRKHNDRAAVITTPIDKLDGKDILAAMESRDTLADELARLAGDEDVCPECGHHHEHGEHHHHDHDEHDHDEHDHDEHDHDEHDHEHHHDHDHDHECGCGCGHEHGHHHADDVFTSWGRETARRFTRDEIAHALAELDDSSVYGSVLRAKGIVEGENGEWIHFDYDPGEPDVRSGSAAVTGRICVIGADLKEDAVAQLFGLQ